MIVSNVLTIDIDELSEKEWRKLFQSLRYMADNVVYEPWSISPKHGWVISTRSMEPSTGRHRVC